MSRMRVPADRTRDLGATKLLEAEVAEALRVHPRIDESTLQVRTESMFELDYSFVWKGERVDVDLKTKVQNTGRSLRRVNERLATGIPDKYVFLLDETTYRKIVWQGGGGYLLAKHVPSDTWFTYGPWELTLGAKYRYDRLNESKLGSHFYKGKLILDLRAATYFTKDLPEAIDRLLDTIDLSRHWCQQRLKTDPLSTVES